jgi:hypothetical protein
MLITVDLNNPNNDVELVGLAVGESAEQRFGPRGYIAYRLFGAAARLLFLAIQKTDKPDIAAATAMQVEREATFVRQRLDELSRPPDGRRNGSRR